MAEATYIIRVQDEREDMSGVPVATPDGVTGKAPTQRTVHQEQSKGNNAAGLVAAQQIAPYINQAVNFGVSQIGAVRGSPELQQRLQVVTGVASFAANVGLGAMTGGVAGAAAMSVVSAVQSAVSTVYRVQEINNQQLIENETISYRKSRMGQSVNRSRFGGVA